MGQMLKLHFQTGVGAARGTTEPGGGEEGGIKPNQTESDAKKNILGLRHCGLVTRET
jgi:hypothetical protein